MGLSKQDLQRLEALLKKQKLDLIKAGETGQQAEEIVELDQARVGRLSRMDAMQAQAMSLETGRRRRQQLVEIEAAIARLDSGEYGDCFDCGGLINPRRLAANPAVRLCISCAESRE